ncbi:MAG: DUF1080 domain-containing protein [Chitinophagaceae bacterium]
MKRTGLLIAIVLLFWVNSAEAQLPALTKVEIKNGWILLFDGKTFEGWQKPNGEPFTGKGWKIENGVLNAAQDHGGDLVTKKDFADFELSVDFKLEKGTNSGIKYSLVKNTSLGCEYQIIDDANHVDAKLGKNGNRTLASLYDLIPSNSNKKAKPLGEWNNIRIISKGKHVEHWLNGSKVLEFERGSSQFKDKIAESKFKNEKGFAEAARSPILLQEHGDVIYFRNIKIRNL